MSETHPSLIDTFIQLANLVTLGQQTDAITGNFTVDGLMAAIVVSPNSGHADSTQDFDSQDLTPSNWESIDFENPPEGVSKYHFSPCSSSQTHLQIDPVC